MVLLVVTITAQILLTRNVDVEYEKNVTETLARYNITSPETTQLICDDVYCKYSMWQIYYINQSKIVLDDDNKEQIKYYLEEVRYNLGTHAFERGNLTRIELETIQEEQIKEWLEKYSGILKLREEIVTREVISNSTTITIKERR